MTLQTINPEPLPTPGIGTGGFVSRTFKRKVTLPAKKKMTYQEANIPEEKEPTIAMKQVFGSTVEQRRTYVRETQDYNKKIKAAKAAIDKYNQAVEEWNTKGRFQTVTVSIRPSGDGSRTIIRKVTLPAKKKMTYQEANIPEEKEPTIAMKQVFGSTVEQRRTYVRETQDYNKKIKDAKAEIDKYNQAVEEWNTKGRFQTVTQKVTEPRSYEITIAPSDKKATTISKGLQEFIMKQPEYKSPAQSQILMDYMFGGIQESKFTAPTILKTITGYTSTTKEFKLPEIKVYNSGEFGIGTTAEPPKQDLKLLFTEPNLYRERMKVKAEELTKYTPALSVEKLKALGLGFYGTTIVSAAQLGSGLGRDPIGTIKNVPKGILETFNPVRYYQGLKTDPYTTVGEIGGQVFTAYSLGYTGKAIRKATRNVYYRTFGKQQFDVYDPEVLAGIKKFPDVKSTAETIKRFEATRTQTQFPELKGKVVGVSSTRFPGKIDVVKTKAQLGQPLIEDSGQWFASLGRGSPYFTGLTNKPPKFKFTLNPFAKEPRPSATVGGFENVSYVPGKVLKVPGFGAVSRYTASKSGTSTLFVTKRSMIGQQEIAPQFFKLGGRLLKEKGTIEEELLAPATTRYLDVGKKLYYTEIYGEIVPLRVVTPVKTSFFKGLLKQPTNILKKTYSAKDLAKAQSETAQYYSNISSNIKTVSPSIAPFVYYESSAGSYRPLSTTSILPSSYKSISKSIYSPVVSTPQPIVSRTYSVSGTSTGYSTTTSYSPSYAPSYTPTSPSYYSTPPALKVTPRPPTTARPILKSRTARPILKSRLDKDKRIEDRPYDTYVLDKGKWIRANKNNEKSNYYGALKLGADITDNSSARSFKIKPTTGKVTNYYPYQPQLIKFYQPSKTGKPKLTTAFIEKTKYLIDTQGERQQITAKGIIANRRKNKGVFGL